MLQRLTSTNEYTQGQQRAAGQRWVRWIQCSIKKWSRRIPRQDPLHTTGWESLTNGWYTIIPKDKVKAESLLITEHSSHTSMCINNASLFLAYQSTGGKIQFIFFWNWMMTVLSLHISATLHLTIFGIGSNNIQSVQYVICVMIVRGCDILGWQYDTQYELLHIYVHHGAPFCVLTVKRHCLPLTRLPRVAGGAPAVNHKATAIWLALRIFAGNEHCNVCDGNIVSEYVFNFFMATYEWMHPKYLCRIFNYLFCIHAKFYKHISSSYYKSDAKVWNLAGDVHIGFFHSSVFKDPTTFR